MKEYINNILKNIIIFRIIRKILNIILYYKNTIYYLKKIDVIK